MNPPIAKWQTRILQANLLAQTLIVVTGALVRVTSSGLGCPTWPECVEGSVTPTSEQTESWHKYVEFGNRLLTGALLIVALAALITVFIINRQRVAGGLAKRSHLTNLSLLVVAGIFFQAVLGGITVLTGLHPLIVGAHFLVSTGLIAISYLLLHRALEPNDVTFEPVAKPVKYLIQAITANVLVIIVLGILVTGTGPHAGDSADVPRLGFDPVTISHVHSTAVQLFFGLVIGFIGVFALVGVDTLRGATDLAGVLMVLLSAFLYAFATNMISTKAPEVPGIAVSGISMAITAVIFAVPAALAFPTQTPSLKATSSLIGLGAICTAAAFYYFFKLLAQVGSARASVVTYINTAVAIGLGVILINEPLTLGIFIGFPLVLIGSYLASRKNSPLINQSN